MDGWKNIRESDINVCSFRKIPIGVHVFSVFNVQKPKKVVNKYERVRNKSKEDYIKSINLREGMTHAEYNVCEVLLITKLFKSVIPSDYFENFDGKHLKTVISMPILQLMRNQLDVFLNRGLPEPELIIYWKRDKITVKYTFLYAKEWEDYKDLLVKAEPEALYREFYWMGRKDRYDEVKMLQWYYPDYNSKNEIRKVI